MIDRFEIADPDGTFLTLSEGEARALLADLQQDEIDEMSPALRALRLQLEEWLS